MPPVQPAPYPVPWSCHIPQPPVLSSPAAIGIGEMAGFWKRQGKLLALVLLVFLTAHVMGASLLSPWYTIDSHDVRAYYPNNDDVFNTTSTVFRFSGFREETDGDVLSGDVVVHSGVEVKEHDWQDYREEHPDSDLPDLYLATGGLLLSGLVFMIAGAASLFLRLSGRRCLRWAAMLLVVALLIDLIAVWMFSALHPMAYHDTFVIGDREVPGGPRTIIYGTFDETYTYQAPWSWYRWGDFPRYVPAYRSLQWGPGIGWYLAIAGLLLLLPCAAILTRLSRDDAPAPENCRDPPRLPAAFGAGRT